MRREDIGPPEDWVAIEVKRVSRFENDAGKVVIIIVVS